MRELIESKQFIDYHQDTAKYLRKQGMQSSGKQKLAYFDAAKAHDDAAKAFKSIIKGKGVRASKKKAKEARMVALLKTRESEIVV